eukprot:scaffold11072_cov101-Isochrysis_galbana.AAC.3
MNCLCSWTHLAAISPAGRIAMSRRVASFPSAAVRPSGRGRVAGVRNRPEGAGGLESPPAALRRGGGSAGPGIGPPNGSRAPNCAPRTACR